MHTPWGASQEQKQIAKGITRYSTASHGGYHVSADRLAQMPDCIRAIKPWAGTGWYEEDCDWALVVLAFPELFTPMDCYYAVKMVKSSNSDYFASLQPYWEMSILKIAEERGKEFQRANADKYASGSSSWGSDDAVIWAQHMTTGARITVRAKGAARDKLSDLPQFFTLEEAEAIGAEIITESGYKLVSKE